MLLPTGPTNQQTNRIFIWGKALASDETVYHQNLFCNVILSIFLSRAGTHGKWNTLVVFFGSWIMCVCEKENCVVILNAFKSLFPCVFFPNALLQIVRKNVIWPMPMDRFNWSIKHSGTPRHSKYRPTQPCTIRHSHAFTHIFSHVTTIRPCGSLLGGMSVSGFWLQSVELHTKR